MTLPNGTVLTQVSRQSCLDRIAAIPLESYLYSQTRVEGSTGKRADCTGWVSYVWATPDEPPEIPGVYLNAYNTASFFTQSVITGIRWADLSPGDMIGYCSPTSPGNGGHAAIWVGGDRSPDGRFHVVDHGSGMGPKDRWVQWNGTSTGWLHPDRLAPWRYVAITEGDDMTPQEVEQAVISGVSKLLSAMAHRDGPTGRNAANWAYAIQRAADGFPTGDVDTPASPGLAPALVALANAECEFTDDDIEAIALKVAAIIKPQMVQAVREAHAYGLAEPPG